MGNGNDDVRYFLAVANLFSKGSGATQSHIVNSRIYELNLREEQFVLYQEILTNG